MAYLMGMFDILSILLLSWNFFVNVEEFECFLEN